MAHFAEIDQNGKVLRVVVIPNEQEAWGQQFLAVDLGQDGTWLQTSYNTRGGVHYDQDGKPDGGVALRKNYAGIGFTYDAQRDAFIPPKKFPSWLLNEQTCLWEPPVAYPTDGKRYRWDEPTINWVEVVPVGQTA